MNSTYYTMKHRLGGEKFTIREKLCLLWSPTPGFNMHKEIVGKRRGRILFEKYCKVDNNKANLIYWRSHIKEWKEILRRVRKEE